MRPFDFRPIRAPAFDCFGMTVLLKPRRA